jgi:hypothetical protein
MIRSSAVHVVFSRLPHEAFASWQGHERGTLTGTSLVHVDVCKLVFYHYSRLN